METLQRRYQAQLSPGWSLMSFTGGRMALAGPWWWSGSWERGLGAFSSDQQTLALHISHHFFLMRKCVGLPQPCLPWFLCCSSGHGAMGKVPLPGSIPPPSFGVTAPSPPPGHKRNIQLLQLWFSCELVAAGLEEPGLCGTCHTKAFPCSVHGQ